MEEMRGTELGLLQLLQLADSALPIGSQAHSFGLETLISDGLLTMQTLAPFLRDYLVESGKVDGLFCRAGHALANLPLDTDAATATFVADWLAINERVSAWRLAAESRQASAALGRRFLTLVLELTGEPCLQLALDVAKRAGTAVHQVVAFGLVGGVLELSAETTVVACLQQNIMGVLSAAQRLLAIGQSQVMRIAWDLKPTLLAVAAASQQADWRLAPLPASTLLLELASMRHSSQPVRLFIS
jgi:urease accessory protein